MHDTYLRNQRVENPKKKSQRKEFHCFKNETLGHPSLLCPISYQFARVYQIHTERNSSPPTSQARCVFAKSSPLLLKAAHASLTNRKLRSIIDNLSPALLVTFPHSTNIPLSLVFQLPTRLFYGINQRFLILCVPRIIK